MKPKLLVIELWGLGDLAIATPFIRAAAEKFDVTLLAKSYARELQPRLWPQIQIHVMDAPWTAFTHKYQLWHWPWRDILKLRQKCVATSFEYGLSARWDPRDHLLLKFLGVKNRLGYSRMHSGIFLTQPLSRPTPLAHRCEYWRRAGKELGIQVPDPMELPVRATKQGGIILVHTGARLPARVWPLPQYQELIKRLRTDGHTVQLLCDDHQLAWWQQQGETVLCPRQAADLWAWVDQACCFIGNDSGPGHLTAIRGVPTFTIFGSNLPEWFLPLHPQAEWIEGRACPYKPCADYCRYQRPHCLQDLPVEEVWPKVRAFVASHVEAVATLPGNI